MRVRGCSNRFKTIIRIVLIKWFYSPISKPQSRLLFQIPLLYNMKSLRVENIYEAQEKSCVDSVGIFNLWCYWELSSGFSRKRSSRLLQPRCYRLFFLSMKLCVKQIMNSDLRFELQNRMKSKRWKVQDLLAIPDGTRHEAIAQFRL